MKFKKGVQEVIGTISGVAFMLLVTTIESDWNKEYLIFAGVNLLILISGVLLLHKFGRSEDE